MKTEHEKLKEIADIIWYDNFMYEKDKHKFMDNKKELYRTMFMPLVEINVREIIFTTEFRNNFLAFLIRKRPTTIWNATFDFDLINFHLDNPVEFLHNLLELWKQKN